MFGFFEGGVTFEPEKDIPDLSGKVIFVTGGNSGLGAESIKQFAKHNPAEIWLAARTRSTAESTVADVQKDVPNANITVVELDLGSFESIKKAAAKFNSSAKRLDILLLNAGIAFSSPGLTTEGYEIQFGTNHMGHASLTQLLLPKLLTTASEPASDVRIVVVGSAGHNFCKDLDLANTHQADKYSRFTNYGTSKLANMLFARELSKRYPTIKTTTIHPGQVVTPITRGVNQSYPMLVPIFFFLKQLFFVSVQEGAKTQLWACVSKDAQSGHYYDPVGKEGAMSKYAKDEKMDGVLWDWTEQELAKHGSPGWP